MARSAGMLQVRDVPVEATSVAVTKPNAGTDIALTFLVQPLQCVEESFQKMWEYRADTGREPWVLKKV